MRKTLLILCLVMLPGISGCAISDMLFGAFGSYYSNGTSRQDRYNDYSQRVEASGGSTF